MIVGALVFALILVVAVAVAGFVHMLSFIGFAPRWIMPAAEWIEWVIFWVDVIYYALFSTSELAKLSRGLWREWKLG